MNYIALYRKWRPRTFDEVVEQESVVTILKNTVKNRRIAHSYLFCGTRGTGKTSIAKIFSRAINCLSPLDGNPCNQCEVCKGILNESILDVLEIDAASNNGVENIRSIIDESSYHAAKAEYKVFIIDEVHMLSTAAFNALLKTLEEPPENVVFILATTEPQKLPVTILSRCQRYDFKRISRDGIKARLEEICTSMDVEFDESALSFLSGKADGALRDAISLLDQTISSSLGSKITLDIARRSVGSLDRGVTLNFVDSLISRDCFRVVSLVDQIFSEGADPTVFICELIELFREILIVISTRNPGNLIYETGEELEQLKKLAENTNIKEITMFIRELSELENSLKWAVQRKIIFEAGMLSLCDRSWGKGTEISDRMLTLERNVADLATNGLKTVYSGAMPLQKPNTKEASEEPAEKKTSKKIEPPTSMPDKNKLRQADPNDWRDFLENLGETLPAASSMLDVFAKAYPIGDYIYVSFDNDNLINVVSDPNNAEKYDECATRAFGRPVHVQIESEEMFAQKIPGLISELESKTETEEDKKNNEIEDTLKNMVKVDKPIKENPITQIVSRDEPEKELFGDSDDSDDFESDIEEFIDEEDED